MNTESLDTLLVKLSNGEDSAAERVFLSSSSTSIPISSTR